MVQYMVGIIYHYYKLVKLLFDNLTPPIFIKRSIILTYNNMAL